MAGKLEDRVKEIIVDQLGVNAEQVTLEASFIDDLGADSLDSVELIMAFEEEFGAAIPEEAAEKLSMSESNLANAEENLRKANVCYEAGVTSTETVLGAQTAWLSAHGDYIDAGIELQMAYAMLQKAEGNIKSNE